MADVPVNLIYTKDEAIVLFELLSRYCKEDRLSVEHEAEKRVLWNTMALLEKILVEPFDPLYLQILQKCRSAVVGNPNGG
jgi:hypothetical protein